MVKIVKENTIIDIKRTEESLTENAVTVVNFQALAAINNHDLSVALFANGWVYEKGGEASFVQNENK